MFSLIFPLAALAACDVYVVEPRYDFRDDLVGWYDVKEYSETYNDITYYSIRVSKSYDVQDEIYIHNFYATEIIVRAYVDFDKITIPRQVVNGFEVEGVGTVYGSELSLNYRIRDRYSSSPTDFCETKAWQ